MYTNTIFQGAQRALDQHQLQLRRNASNEKRFPPALASPTRWIQCYLIRSSPVLQHCSLSLGGTYPNSMNPHLHPSWIDKWYIIFPAFLVLARNQSLHPPSSLDPLAAWVSLGLMTVAKQNPKNGFAYNVCTRVGSESCSPGVSAVLCVATSCRAGSDWES